MSSKQHTEGPWARHDTEDYAEIHPASGKQRSPIALVGRGNDADLISAAPDLLEALKGAVGALEFSRDYHGDLGNEEQAFAQDRLDAALKAIAEATGGRMDE